MRFLILVGVLVALAAVLVLGYRSGAQRELQHWIEEQAQTVEEPAVPRSPRPRTTHLFHVDSPPAFEPVDDRPAAAAPAGILQFVSYGAPEQQDGWTELTRESGLRNDKCLDLPAEELASVVLRLEVRRGGLLTVWLSQTGSLEKAQASFAFDVKEAGGIQEVELTRPLALGAGPKRACFLTLTGHSSNQRPPNVRLESATYVKQTSAFRARASGAERLDIHGSVRPAAWQSAAGRFRVELPAREEPTRGRLKLAVGVVTGAAGRFSIEALDADGKSTTLADGELVVADGWKELSLPLPDSAVALELAGAPGPDAVLAWSGLRRIDVSRPARCVVFVLTDTLRADALGCYGHPDNPTPVIDRLAADGVRFARAYAQGFWTRPSMPSIMTGHYVAATGVRRHEQRLPESYVTLAERMEEEGFFNVSVLTNTNAGDHNGLLQGYHRVRPLRSLSRLQKVETAKLVDEVVLPMLPSLADDDLFLYVHLMDAHAPYGPEAPPEPNPFVPADGPPLKYDKKLDRPWSGTPTTSQRAALYQEDVRRMDAGLGPLFDALDRAEEPPIVVLVADHGESLGERGRWGHGLAPLYPENIQVPLVIRAPGVIPPASVRSEPVEIRHVGSTLLALLGSDRRLGNGRDLLGAVAEGGALSEAHEGKYLSLFRADHDYVGQDGRFAVYGGGDFTREAFSWWSVRRRGLSVDSLVQSYLDTQHPIRVEHWQAVDTRRQLVDPQALEALEALGYIER